MLEAKQNRTLKKGKLSWEGHGMEQICTVVFSKQGFCLFVSFRGLVRVKNCFVSCSYYLSFYWCPPLAS
jgi:hypothetical protein